MGKLLDVPIKVEYVEFDDFFTKDGVAPENVKTDETMVYTPDIFSQADLIAFDLTELEWRKRLMNIIPLYPYRIVIANRRDEKVSHIGQLQKKRFVVFSNTSHEDILHTVSDNLGLDIEKFSALGQFSAGIAHELNTPLGAIQSSNGSVINFFGDNFIHLNEFISTLLPERRKLFNALLAIGFLQAPHLPLHDTGRQKRKQLQQDTLKDLHPVDVVSELEIVLTLMHNKLKYGIMVEKIFEPFNVYASANELSQVWINLISNAAQAMNFEGKLTLKTEKLDGWGMISISDSGPGIPDEIKDKIFEPFFTTKKDGDGIGLGLDIC